MLNWRHGLSETPPDLAMFDAVIDAALAGAAFAVPEPRAGALIALGMAALIVRRRTAQTAA